MAVINIVGNVYDQSMVSEYDNKDSALLSSVLKPRLFNPKTDSVLLTVSDINGVELAKIENYQQYYQTVFSDLSEDGSFSEISVDPVSDLKQFGFKEGNYIVKYSLLRPILNNNSPEFYVREIFSKRDEISLSKVMDDELLLDDATSFNQRLSSNSDIKDFLVKIDGIYYLANNLKPRVNTTTNKVEVGIKLYKSVDANVESKSLVSLYEELSISNTFSVNLNTVVTPSPGLELKGTNFNVPVNSNYSPTGENSSLYSLTSLINATSLEEINNLISNNNIKLNIDYTISSPEDFGKFTNFSSAEKRISVFKQKLSNLEGLSAQKASNGLNNASTASIDTDINSIVNNFDHYEQYLYFESGSSSWPKTNSTRPYTLASTSLIGSTNYTNDWYTNMLASGSEWDNNNNNNLWYTIPEFIRNNPENERLHTYVNMIGHHYDNIWIIIKNLTEIHNTKHDNKLSNEVMYEVLKSYGIDLKHSDVNKNIQDYLLKKDNQDADSAFLNEIYKRLHHNIALLAKTKGTYEGTRLLLLTLGVPDTILYATEHGRLYRDENHMYTSKVNTYHYYPQMTGSSYFQYDWFNSQTVKDTVEFRFKFDEVPAMNVTRSLFFIESQIYYTRPLEVCIHADHADPRYAGLILNISGSNEVRSEMIMEGLPIFQHTGSWWSLMLQHSQSGDFDTFKLFVKNQIDGKIGFTGSCQITTNNITSPSFRTNYKDQYTTLKFGHSIIGSISDVRIWNLPILESDFNAHVLNPRSIQESTVGSLYSLNARYPLGTELKIGTSSLNDTFYLPSKNIDSLVGNMYYRSIDGTYITPTISSSVESFYYNSPYVGIGTNVSNKIFINSNTITDNVLVYSNRLLKKLVSEPSLSSFGVTNSTAKSINKDIVSTYGNFDIGQLIGDPNVSGSYIGYDAIKIEYFSKYSK